MSYFTQEYKNEVFNFLDKVFDKHCARSLLYAPEDGDMDSSDALNELFDDVMYILNADWWKAGASKIVFYFEEFKDIVVKIPFHGSCCGIIDEEGFVDTSDPINFDGCDVGDGWDYCLKESLVYEQKIEKSKYKDMFAATEYIGTLYDCPIYIARYVDSDSAHQGGRYSADSLETAKNLRKTLNKEKIYTQFDTVTLAFLVETMGEKGSEDFIRFLEDAKIDDMHDENYVITEDSKIIIIDYSGFDS